VTTAGEALHVVSLTKKFGSVAAVTDLSFDVLPGRVTGFLGPNGSGKTTTLRCILGLVTPTSGSALVGDSTYVHLATPSTTVGAALEASGFHPARSARSHLRIVAAAGGIPDARVDKVLEMVGLTAAAKRKVGGYSLGMRQRLALAGALLGDPGILILDEPANGLDPEGIAWLRMFLRALAADGRTVLVSSHVLSEVQQTVDDVIIISQGRLVHAGTLEDLESTTGARVFVRTPSPNELIEALRPTSAAAAGVTVEIGEGGVVTIAGLSTDEIGHVAFTHGIELHQLSAETGDLERVFLELTASGIPGGSL